LAQKSPSLPPTPVEKKIPAPPSLTSAPTAASKSHSPVTPVKAGTKKFVEGVSPPVSPLSKGNFHPETVKKGRLSRRERKVEKKAEKMKGKHFHAQSKGQKRDLSPLSQDEDDDMLGNGVRGGSPVKLTKKNHNFLK
jgi:hypothetical protein